MATSGALAWATPATDRQRGRHRRPERLTGNRVWSERARKYPGLVTSNESWQKYLEAGAAVGQATAARAEDIAKRLFDPDEDERESAWRDLEQLTRFGRLMGEQLAEMARAEVTRQLKSIGNGSFDLLFERIADLLGATPSPAKRAEDADEAVLEAKVVVVSAPEAVKPEAKKHKNKASGAKTKKKPKSGKDTNKNSNKNKEKVGPKQHATEREPR